MNQRGALYEYKRWRWSVNCLNTCTSAGREMLRAATRAAPTDASSHELVRGATDIWQDSYLIFFPILLNPVRWRAKADWGWWCGFLFSVADIDNPIGRFGQRTDRAECLRRRDAVDLWRTVGGIHGADEAIVRNDARAEFKYCIYEFLVKYAAGFGLH